MASDGWDAKPYKTASAPEGAREGDIPYFAAWSDGSIYTTRWLDKTTWSREYIGPLFNASKWQKEVISLHGR